MEVYIFEEEKYIVLLDSNKTHFGKHLINNLSFSIQFLRDK